MRFLRKFLKTLLFGSLFLALAIVAGAYLTLYLQSSKVRSGVTKARFLSRNPTHYKDCYAPENSSNEYPVRGYQLRFLDDTRFVVEAVCGNPLKGPFRVEENSLAMRTAKEPGYSGIFFPTDTEQDVQANLVVTFFGLRRQLNYADNKLTSGFITQKDIIKPGESFAQTTCAGWGYACCNPLSQSGAGKQALGTTLDCFDNCYAVCNNRPLILSFKSDPREDSSRVATIRGNNQLVVFAHTIQDIDNQGVYVILDFGDGERSTTNNTTDQLSHTYKCNQPVCTYQAKLTAVDSRGLEAATTRLSEITIRQISN